MTLIRRIKDIIVIKITFKKRTIFSIVKTECLIYYF